MFDGSAAIMAGTAWDHARAVLAPVLRLAPRAYLTARASEACRSGVADAVRAHHTPTILDAFLSAMALQGIGDRAAFAFLDRVGRPSHHAILRELDQGASCPCLGSYWRFEGCGFRRGSWTCAEPRHRSRCLVPRIPARKGALAVGAAALVLFVRDVCDGDLVGWIDGRLEAADRPDLGAGRGRALTASVVGPLSEVSGVGPKVASMLLADFLLGADPRRERWTTAGADAVVVDSLVHNFLHRSGILGRLGAEHAYGPRCYAPGGCVDVVHGLADRFDAREVDPTYPARFPRLLQFAIWSFCAASERNVCNGNRVDDRRSCALRYCPTGPFCDRVVLKAPT